MKIIFIFFLFLLTPGYLLANADGCSYFKDKLADRMKYYRNSKKTDEIKNSYGYAYTDIQSCLMHEKKSEYCIKIKEEALGKAIDCANKRINVSIPNNIDWLVAPFLLIKYQEDKKCPVKKSLYNYRLWRDPYINTYLEKEKIKIKIKGVTGYKIRKALIEKSGCKIKKRRLIKKSSDNYKNIYILKVKNKETYTTVNKVDYISTKNIDYFENCPRLRPSGYIESVKQLKDCHFKLGIVKNNPILSVVSHIVEIKQGKIFSIKNNSKNLAIIKDVKIIIRKKNENGISNYTIKIVDPVLFENPRQNKIFNPEVNCGNTRENKHKLKYFFHVNNITENDKFNYINSRYSYLHSIEQMISGCL